MLEDAPRPPVARRVSLVTRALRPLQQRVGEVQADVAFLVASNVHNLRHSGTPISRSDVQAKRLALAEALQALENVIEELPPRHRTDSRLGDTRAAIQRLSQSLDALEAGAAG